MIFKLARRNIFRNKKRSIITVLSVFVAVFLALLVRSMQLGVYANVIDNIAGKFTGYVQVHARGYWEDKNLDNALHMTQGLRDSLLAHKGIRNLVPRLESFSLASTGSRTKAAVLTGMDPEAERLIYPVEKRLVEGDVFTLHEHAVCIGKGMAHYFDLKTGDTLYLIGQGYHGMSAAGRFTVKGIFDLSNGELNRSLVLMPLPVLQEYLSAPGMLTNLILVKEENYPEDTLAGELSAGLGNDYEVMTWKEMLPILHQSIVADNVGGLYMVFILYMIIAFGIFSTVMMMTQERLFELGIQIAIGMRKRLIIKSLWIESFLLSLTGLLAGIVVAFPILYYFHYHPVPLPSEKAKVLEKYGFIPEIPFSIDPSLFVTHGMIILLITLFAALYPAVTVGKLDVLKAIQRK